MKILRKWLSEISCINFLEYMIYVKELKIDKSTEIESEFEKYRIIFNLKEGAYDIWYKFNKKDKYKILTWGDGHRLNFFDYASEDEIALFLFRNNKKNLLIFMDIDDGTGETDIEYLMEICETPINNVLHCIPQRIITKMKFSICKHNTYFKKQIELEDEQAIDDEISRLMDKND